MTGRVRPLPSPANYLTHDPRLHLDQRSNAGGRHVPAAAVRVVVFRSADQDPMDRVIRDRQQQLAQRLLQDADAFDSSIHARPSLSPDQWRLIARWLQEEPCPT